MESVSASETQGIHYAWLILPMSILTVMGAIGFARFGYTVILPNMKAGLALGYTEMGLLATGNFAGYLVFSLVGGILASRFGPRVVIALSMFLVGTAMFFTGTAGAFTTALVMRIVTGMGSGGSNVPVMGLLSAWFGPRWRGMASGLAVGGSGLGLAVTGNLVPLVNARFGIDGWRVSWHLFGGVVFLLGVFGYLVLRNHPAEKGTSPIGGTAAAKPPAGSQPLQWGLVYKSRRLWHLAIIYLLYGFAYIIYATFFTAYLTGERQLAEQDAGNLWALAGYISIASGFLWGTLSDLLGRKYGLAMVFLLQAAAFYVMGWATSPSGYYLSTIIFALTAWSIPGIMAAASADYVGPRLAPAALGMVTFVFGFGQALGPSVAGYLADTFASFTPAFTVSAVAALCGAIGSLLLRPPVKQL